MDKLMENVYQVLNGAGWYEGRNLRNQIENSPLYKILPQKVNDFFSEFGGLTFEIGLKRLKFDIESYHDPEVFKYYNQECFKSMEVIDTASGDDSGYYYSTLIGTWLFYISPIDDNESLFMDEYENFYLKSDIGDLAWVGHKVMHFFEEMLSGWPNALVLDDGEIEWIPRKDKKPMYAPPLNLQLRSYNPWDYC